MDNKKNSFKFKISWAEAFFTSLMIGAAEMYLAVYALDQGLGEILAGFVVALPMLFGASLQLIIPRPIKIKKFVLIVIFLQVVSLVCLSLTSLMSLSEFRVKSSAIIFVLIGIYWACSYLVQTYWNFWLSPFIEQHQRARFFSIRGQMIQYGTMLGAFFTGTYLHQYSPKEYGMSVYLWPFGIAILARVVSLQLMSRLPTESNKSFAPEKNIKKNMKEFILRVSQAELVLIGFLFVFNLAIFITAPFVAPFLIVQRGFDSASFMASLLALLIGKTAAFLVTQKFVEKFGVKRVLAVGLIGMSPLPMLWHWIDHTFAATLLQGTSGFFWGFFEAGISILLFSEITQKNKIAILSVHNFLNAIAIVVGTLIGGQILWFFDKSLFAYDMLFVSGSSLRLFLVLFFIFKFLTFENQRSLK